MTELPPPATRTLDEILNIQKKIIADCEKISEDARKRAIESPTPTTTKTTLREDEIIRDQAWKDREQRRKRRSCARCSLYYKYSIVEHRTPIPNSNYDGTRRFYNITYEMLTETVKNDGNIDNEFYDLCDRCIDHIRGVKAYDLPNDRQETEKRLIKARQAEITRRWSQEEELNKAKQQASQRRKHILDTQIKQASETFGLDQSSSSSSSSSPPSAANQPEHKTRTKSLKEKFQNIIKPKESKRY